MSFEQLNLNKPLISALDDLGYVEATRIQKAVFSKIMSGKDLVGVAQTGTGKTFAYLLPLLRLWKFSKQKEPRILIVVPTRELVLQIKREAEILSTYMNVKVVGVYGGTNIRTQKDLVYDSHDILISTPGRLLDLALSRALKLNHIKTLVIDEFDEMLNLGFRVQLTNILDLLPKRRQSLLFSATMSEESHKIVNDFFISPEVIEIERHGTPLDQIEQLAYEVPNFNTKVNLLQHLLDESYEKVLLFVRTKKLADILYDQLLSVYPGLDVIHSNKSQNYRINAVKKFESGETTLLIATDLIARGVDITEISHVINFDLPEEPVSYMHRIGRTGRADQNGIAVSFVSETNIESFQAIQDLMNKEVELHALPADVAISEELLEIERMPLGGDKAYYRYNDLKKSGGAFHEKSNKNKKTNQGSPFRNKKKKYKKPIKRSGKK